MKKTYSREFLAELRRKYILSSLVAEKIRLRPMGRNDYLGLCPFHSEDTPSFRVNDTRFICFGCKKRGDVVDWVMEMEGLDFQEAVEVLAEGHEIKERGEPGVEEPPFSPVDCAAAYRIYQINERYWGGRLTSLQERIDAGICGDDGSDRYANRTLIPVRNTGGYICGFLGRKRDKDPGPKYICPPSNPAWQGKRMLFGAEKLLDNNWPTICEGAFDAMAVGGFGVATLGCLLTQEQVDIIKAKGCYMADVYYDGDPPGAMGALNAVRLLAENEICGDILLCPPGKDPATCDSARGVQQDYFLLCDELCVMANNEWTHPLLNNLAKSYVEDNLRSGYAHYNVVDWVLQAHPEHVKEITETRDAMIKEPTEDNIKAFLKAWIKPCRDVRRLHGKFKAKGS